MCSVQYPVPCPLGKTNQNIFPPKSFTVAVQRKPNAYHTFSSERAAVGVRLLCFFVFLCLHLYMTPTGTNDDSSLAQCLWPTNARPGRLLPTYSACQPSTGPSAVPFDSRPMSL